jgi:two-component system, LuxR family, sensor kinase FixL
LDFAALLDQWSLSGCGESSKLTQRSLDSPSIGSHAKTMAVAIARPRAESEHPMTERQQEPHASPGSDSARRLEAARRETVHWVWSGVIHESRNALQQISAGSELLAMELAGRDDLMRMVHGLDDGLGRLLRVFDDLGAYSANVPVNCGPVDAGAVCHQAWEAATHSSRFATAELRTTAAPTDATCHADAALLGKTVTRLFKRLLVLGDPRPVIEIGWHPAKLGDQPAVATTFSRLGFALPAEEQEQWFEPFGLRHGRGTGLEMAIARRWVELQGGQLAARPGSAGTEVVLTLPRAAP